MGALKSLLGGRQSDDLKKQRAEQEERNAEQSRSIAARAAAARGSGGSLRRVLSSQTGAVGVPPRKKLGGDP